jgi:hypothetical protein
VTAFVLVARSWSFGLGRARYPALLSSLPSLACTVVDVPRPGEYSVVMRSKSSSPAA